MSSNGAPADASKRGSAAGSKRPDASLRKISTSALSPREGYWSAICWIVSRPAFVAASATRSARLRTEASSRADSRSASWARWNGKTVTATSASGRMAVRMMTMKILFLMLIVEAVEEFPGARADHPVREDRQEHEDVDDREQEGETAGQEAFGAGGQQPVQDHRIEDGEQEAVDDLREGLPLGGRAAALEVGEVQRGRDAQDPGDQGRRDEGQDDERVVDVVRRVAERRRGDLPGLVREDDGRPEHAE